MRENVSIIALPIGTILKSQRQNYRIESVLGIGGFGITYKVSAETIVQVGNVCQTTNLVFAVKELFIKGCDRAVDGHTMTYAHTLEGDVKTCLQDFLTEAKRLNRIGTQSENIVKVNEVFEANGTAYYVMEYLRGGSIADYIKKCGPLSWKETLSMIVPIAQAVALLHKERLLHLDIKPDNIMLKRSSTGKIVPVLIDFGIAKHFDENGHPTSHLMAKGASDGYAPMEQYLGIDSFAPEIDIYAIGATILYLLTAKHPPRADKIYSEINLKALLPNTLVEQRKAAIISAMHPNKNARTRNIAALLQNLNGLRQNRQNGKRQNKGTKLGDDNCTLKLNQQRSEETTSDKHRSQHKGKMALTIALISMIVAAAFFLGKEMKDNDKSTKHTTLQEDSIQNIEEINGKNLKEDIQEISSVDLGLPSGTLWADRNINAANVNKDGDHFAFGEVVSKEDYSETTGNQYKDGESIIGTSHDVARKILGDGWQMPSREQFQEIIDNCTAVCNVWGYTLTGPNGNTLFFPYTEGNSGIGYYWSGNKGYVFEFQSGAYEPNMYISENFATYCALSIRAVRFLRDRQNQAQKQDVKSKKIVEKNYRHRQEPKNEGKSELVEEESDILIL